ncbi:hypothetical protein WA026_004986 [Henosepilachna vigintioctopunctata]|uniref:PiggyBac transposable element-derived protein domain-containing protein n=1 Tax=Henosepilachna vigintioctopunctata TaxID=420089 RepID=A0AAW1UT74_9CUCU
MREDFDVTPDYKFRKAEYKGNKITLKWRVMKRNTDIADTYVVLRNLKSDKGTLPKPLFETTIEYFKRSIDINVDNELKKQLNGTCDVQLCILGSTSQQSIRSFYQSQCKGICTLKSKSSAPLMSRNNHVIIIVSLLSLYYNV